MRLQFLNKIHRAMKQFGNDIPYGYAFVVDNQGNYLVDNNNNYIIVAILG